MSASDRAAPTDPRVSLAHRLQFAAFRGFELCLLKPLPLGAIARLGRMLGAVAFPVAGPYRKLALRNLEIAFGGETSPVQRKEMAREHFKRLFSNLLCGFKLPLMSPQQVLKHVSVEDVERVKQAAQEGQSIVYAVCHLSCWEMLTQVPSLFVFGTKPGSVYQPLGNPLLNALVLRRREKLGYHLFDRSEGFNGAMQHLKDGNVLGVLVDQHAGDHGTWSPFFGRLASTSSLAALLARRSKSLLVPILIQTRGVGRWRLRCLPPLLGEKGVKPRSVDAVTAELNQVVEQVVREDPPDWFWVHNRWKTPNPNFLLQHYRRGVVLPEGVSEASLRRFELLVRSPNWLGDACMALPMVRALRAGRPDLRLTVFGPEKLRDLWEAMPEVDAYIGKQGKEGLRSVSRRIRSSGIRYDAGILLTNSTRSTLEFWLAGIPRLVGYPGSLRRRLLNQVAPEQKPGLPPLHHAERYMKLAEHAGADTAKPALWEPAGSGSTSETLVRIGICAGAEYGPAKRWPLERYAQVANDLRHTPDGRPIEWHLFGAPGEVALGEKLSAGIEARHVNRVGKTRLAELITELRSCDLLVTNDTGTMHLAAALGVPTVSIFGSTEPTLTGPLGDRHRIVRHHVPCSPCFRRECPFGHYDCMTGIPVKRVVEELREALSDLSAATA